MTPDSGPGENGLTGGRMTWAQAVSGPLAGHTCLWQDLDGLHVAPPPADAPPTSILWGWGGDSVLVRARLDGDVAYVAVYDETAADADAVPVTTVAWAPDDGRVAAAVAAAGAGRGPAPGREGVGTRYEQLIVGGIDTGPVTFIRPAPSA
ncbi:MAG: hypothetical protein ACRDOI_40630 [Trebonia sp.]